MDGDLALHDASSRNRNAIASQRGVPGRFIKWEREPGREAGIYARLAAFTVLAPYVPRLAAVDAGRGLLILEIDAGAQDLWAYGLAQRRIPAAIAAQMGRALGALHRVTRLPAPHSAPDRAPFALRIHRPHFDDLRILSPASVELVKVLQRHGQVGEHLDELRRAWIEAALVHTDVKWPNVLIVPGADHESAEESIRLVDWEQADDGDPAWDVGSAFAAFVSLWLYSIPSPAALTPAELASSARVPLAGMRAAIQACWTAYLESAHISPSDADPLLRRSVGLGAARLIRTAFEESQPRERLPAHATLHLQVAANMLADPDDAAARLLGLDRPHRAIA